MAALVTSMLILKTLFSSDLSGCFILILVLYTMLDDGMQEWVSGDSP